jgi:hypothetical protein
MYSEIGPAAPLRAAETAGVNLAAVKLLRETIAAQTVEALWNQVFAVGCGTCKNIVENGVKRLLAG